MNDYCYEVTIKRDNGNYGKLFPILAYSAFVVFAVFFNIVPMFFGLNIIYFTGMITFGIWYLIHRLNRNLNVEHELSIINDLVTLTSITDGKKRVVLSEFSIRDCDYIGPVTKDRFAEDREKAAFTLNSTQHRELPITEDIWYFLVNAGNYRHIVAFNFEQEMFPVFRRYNPRGTEFIKISKPDNEEGSEEV